MLMNFSKEKLYYILLGLGIGAVLSGSIIILNPNVKYLEYTEDQIKQMARDLGMVSIKDNVNLEKDKSLNEDIKNDELLDEIDEDTDETDNANDKEGDEVKDIIEFEIFKGDNTEVIADKLSEQGIIEDKQEFQRIIIEKGVNKKVRYGVYELEKGMDYEEIIDKFVNSQ